MSDEGAHAVATINRVLNPLRKPPAADKPARALLNDRAAARDVVLYLIANGEMALATTHRLRIDTRGNILYPRPQDQLYLSSTMAGVTYVKPDGKPYQPLPNVHPAFALVLHRLAERLKQAKGVTRIYAGGIGSGRDNQPQDCHNTGRCIDFYGADTASGTLKVKEDWGQQAFVLIDAKGRDNRRDKSKWPVGFKKTFYRLNPDKVDPPKAIRPGRDFFLLVYKIATEQCADLGSDTKSSDLGAEKLAASQIIHPDHPDSKRDSHQDHMHFQIGAAFW